MDDQMKSCILCGMPLLKAEDYPEGADQSKVTWCKFCGTKDTMHSYTEAVTGMAGFIQKTQGLSDEEAKKAAIEAVENSVAFKSGLLKKE